MKVSRKHWPDCSKPAKTSPQHPCRHPAVTTWAALDGQPGNLTASIAREVGYPLLKESPRGQASVTQKTPKLVRSGLSRGAPYVCTPSGFGSTSRCSFAERFRKGVGRGCGPFDAGSSAEPV